jgi:chromate transporter
MENPDGSFDQERVPLRTIAWQWGRLGIIGFGGPPTHIALLRRLCVEDRKWMDAAEFEDAIAVTNLLPGPASTQLAIFCAWRLRRTKGALLGGISFILPGLVLILLLSAVFLARHPSDWVLGAAAGAGAAVPAVAIKAASGLVKPSWSRGGGSTARRTRWFIYLVLGGIAAATIGPYLVVVLLGCGLVETTIRRGAPGSTPVAMGAVAGHVVALGGFAALGWVAFKVGALSYGGGFVIVPLMQHDAVSTYHWMTGAQFLNAVALGQITPGPVVLTVAVVGYAARGIRGGLVATFIAFAPSFVFVVVGGPRFDRIRSQHSIQSFFSGAGPAVIGAIAGSAIPLGLAFQQLWQVPLLVAALLWFLAARRGVVSGLLLAGGIGVALALLGVPV